MGAAASTSDERRAHFTCVWAIENVSSLAICTYHISSPIFTVKSMQNTKWSLELYAENRSVYIYIFRKEDDYGPEKIEIDYELSILGADGLPLTKEKNTSTFLRHEYSISVRNREDFSGRKAEFLPRDVLTIRCRMWRIGTETPKPDVCFARTRMGMDRHCFVWAIKDFSNLPLGHKTKRHLKSTSESAPDLVLIFYLRKCDNKSYVCMDIHNEGVMGSYQTSGEISLLDAEGTVVHSERLSHSKYSYINFFEKQKLLSDKATMLPNDELSLRCEFEVLYGSLWSRIESSAEFESMISTDVEGGPTEEMAESVTDSCNFRQNVRRFFEDGIFSDVTLRADAETFLVHKIILSSRSSVFKAMFTNDMREKTSSCIDIPDVDAATLRRLLRYIYMNELPEIEWDKAVDLLRAADKYALIELKKQCSGILKSNVSRTNFCCFLFLSEMYHDEELRKAVLDFISQNLYVFNSAIWKLFKKEYSEIAMETMERIAYNVADL